MKAIFRGSEFLEHFQSELVFLISFCQNPVCMLQPDFGRLINMGFFLPGLHFEEVTVRSQTLVPQMITSWPPVEGVAPAVASQEWLWIERADWRVAPKSRISTKSQVGGTSIGRKGGGLGKGGRGIRKPWRVRTNSIEEVCIRISLCVVSIS